MNNNSQPLLTIVEELKLSVSKIDPDAIEGVLKELLAAKRIFLAGAGRSGLMIRGFAMRLMHMGKIVHVVGDTTTPAIRPGDLLFIGSGSGKTASLLAMAQKARQLNVPVVLVTIDPTSPIAQLAQQVVRIPAPSPKATADAGQIRSIQPMGSLFEQTLLLLLESLILLLMEREQMTSDTMFANHANLE